MLKAYDTELIRKCINEETGAFDQIPIKTRAKTGHYRLNSHTIFRPVVYLKRNQAQRIDLQYLPNNPNFIKK